MKFIRNVSAVSINIMIILVVIISACFFASCSLVLPEKSSSGKQNVRSSRKNLQWSLSTVVESIKRISGLKENQQRKIGGGNKKLNNDPLGSKVKGMPEAKEVIKKVTSEQSKIQNTDANKKVVVNPLPIPLVSPSDELDEDKDGDRDSNITTKVYKSTDPSYELLEDESEVDPTLESDLVSKEDLISMYQYGKGKGKSKLVQRSKITDVKLATNENHIIYPWVISLVLILSLGFIFKFLIKKSG